MERLQKHLAQGGIASRRQSEEIIKSGRVKVNGKVVTEMGYLLNPNDSVTVDDILVVKEVKKYYLLNKPRYLLSAVTDDLGRKTVISTLPKELRKERLFPIGRLDYDTKGVLLLTNDGELMNLLVGPKSNIEKEYLVRVKGIIADENIKPLRKGLTYKNVSYLPCWVRIEEIDKVNQSSLLRIIIKEGRYHQIKLMFEAINFPTKRLTRVRFGNIEIGDLGEGQLRPLTVHEVKALYGLAKSSQ